MRSSAPYDWGAFGAPWHPSYRNLDNSLRRQQLGGILGVHLPTLHGMQTTLIGNRGLLILAPVLIAAAVGLVLVWQAGYRPEALLCAAMVVAYAVASFGYFDPNGGRAPAPRFVAVALPFLALGLGPAFARWTRTVALLSAISLVGSVAMALTWQNIASYRETVWGEIARTVTERGRSRLMTHLGGFALDQSINHIVFAAAVYLLAAAAFAASLSGRFRGPPRWRA